MNLTSLITVFCVVLILLTGLQVFILKKDDSRNQAFLLLAILVGWMNICWYEMAHTTDIASAMLYRKLQGIWTFVTPLMVYCLWKIAAFDQKEIKAGVQSFVIALVSVPAIYFFYLEVFTDAGHGSLVLMENGAWGLLLGDSDTISWLRAIWTLLLYSLCIYLLFIAYQEEFVSRLKRMKGILLLVLSFCFAASFIQNYILPNYGVILPVNESITTLFSILIFGWALTNFKPIEIGAGTAMDNILGSMTNLLVVTDRDFRIKNVNAATASFFNCSQEVLLNEPICLLFGKEYQQDCKSELIISSELESREVELETPYGSAYMHLTVSTVYDEDNQIVGYTFIGTDLTEFKNAERKIRQYARKLKNSNEALEHFAYIASHDLKEPLRMVNGFVTLLEREMGPDMDNQTTEYFSYITDGVKRMYAIIESILDISKVDYKNGNLERVETVAIVEKLEKKFSKELKPITIQYDRLPNVWADRTNLEILFHNIIENGIKYNNKSNPIIEIDCHPNGNFNEFSIRDNGIGIEPAFHDHIFKMFKRLHTRVQYEGTGMGLAISKRIVEGLGGQIWVESVPGQGTTFKFCLPQLRENVKAVAKKPPFPLTQAS